MKNLPKVWIQVAFNDQFFQTIKKYKMAVVVHTCNHNFLGGWDQEACSLRSAWAKMFISLHLNRKSWSWWYELALPATVGSINRRMVVQSDPGQKRDIISQNKTKQYTDLKRAGGLAHAPEYLPSWSPEF
jgi:hypothetical protein